MTTTEDRPAGTGSDGTAATTATAPTGHAAAGLPAPQDRGHLEVSPNVVRKLAQRVADRAPGTLWAPRRIVGEQGSSAKVDGAGGTVDIALDVALRYPAPVRETTEEVRRRVTSEVQRVTGYRVRAVRITVSALLPETHPRVT